MFLWVTHFALVRLDFREADVTNLESTIKRTVAERNVMNENSTNELSVAEALLFKGEL